MVGSGDVGAWPGLVLIEPADGGNRNEVWRGELASRRVAVRRSRRSSASLAWELDLLDRLDGDGFIVPTAVPAADGRRSVDGVVVQDWLEGRPPRSDADWRLVADELQRLHRVTVGHDQRPGCVAVTELAGARRSGDVDLDAMPGEVIDRVLAVFADVVDVPIAVVHGDPGPGNIRLGDDGSVGLLDWDESRVDVVWHDLSNLGRAVLPDADHLRAQRLSDAWEAANGWVLEPAYARRRLAGLGDLDDPSH